MSDSSIDFKNIKSLTLEELHQALTARGVVISYSGLSGFVNQGNIPDLLQAGGRGNRREYDPAAVDVLAAFIPHFKAQKGVKAAAAPAALAAFLDRSGESIATRPPAVLQIPETLQTDLLDKGEQALGALEQIRDLLQAQAQPPEDRLIDSAEAAVLLCCSPRSVRRYVRPVRRGVWSRLSVLEAIDRMRRGAD